MTYPTYDVKVHSRSGVLYQGRVSSVSSFNEVGKFDVLAEHANFISLIKKSITLRDETGVIREIPFNDALLRVRQNSVEVYIGVEGLAENQY